MRTPSFSVLVLLIAAAIGCHSQPSAEPVGSISDLRSAQTSRSRVGEKEQFAIVLERSTAGWSATCSFGCSWREVTMICDSCEVRIDDSGIRPAEARPATSMFAFSVRPAGSGWKARGLNGVHWVELGFSCNRPGVCKSRINQSGVAGI